MVRDGKRPFPEGVGTGKGRGSYAPALSLSSDSLSLLADSLAADSGLGSLSFAVESPPTEWSPGVTLLPVVMSGSLTLESLSSSDALVCGSALNDSLTSGSLS